MMDKLILFNLIFFLIFNELLYRKIFKNIIKLFYLFKDLPMSSALRSSLQKTVFQQDGERLLAVASIKKDAKQKKELLMCLVGACGFWGNFINLISVQSQPPSQCQRESMLFARTRTACSLRRSSLRCAMFALWMG